MHYSPLERGVVARLVVARASSSGKTTDKALLGSSAGLVEEPLTTSVPTNAPPFP